MSRDEEFTQYVAERWDRLVRSAMLLGATRDEAEDLTQAALTRCLVHWSKVRGAQDRDAYVHRVLVNTFTSARRRRWTGERPVETVPEQLCPDETARIDTADALQRSLARLSVEQRAVVVLRFYAHLSERQSAMVLDIPEGTVKSRLSRALKALGVDPQLDEVRGNR